MKIDAAGVGNKAIDDHDFAMIAMVHPPPGQQAQTQRIHRIEFAHGNAVGAKPFELAVEDLAIPGEFDDENRSSFIDWNRSELYELQRGEGECAI